MSYGLIALSVYAYSATGAQSTGPHDGSQMRSMHRRKHFRAEGVHRHEHFTADDSLLEREQLNLRTASTSFCAPSARWIQEWADEFDGDALGPDWEAVSSHSGDQGSNHSAPVAGLGVTACRSAKCRDDNVQVRNGALHLISERDTADAARYYTGAVSTRGHKNWKDDKPYRLCIRAKLPGSSGANGAGIWPAHWMLPDNDVSEKCLDGGEMDIMEMINGDSNAFSTYHWLSSWPKKSCGDFSTFHKSRNNVVQLADYPDTFHEFGVERSADHITYAVDGRVVHHLPASKLSIALSHDPFYLILNTAVGGSWPGEPTDDTHFPTEHVIDYVRVVRKTDAADDSTDASTLPVGATDGGSNWADHHLRGSSLFEIGSAPPPLSRHDPMPEVDEVD